MQTFNAWAYLPPFNYSKHMQEIRRRDSLENKVLEFFDRNPDEELTAGDVLIKFGAEGIHTRKTLSKMVARGLLRRRSVDSASAGRDLYIYSRA